MTMKFALLAAALAAALPASADPAQFGGASFVEPGDHRVPSLLRRSFIVESTVQRAGVAARHLLGAAEAPSARPASHVSPGEAQLAASLGLDPAAFTWAELARLKALAERRSDED